MTVTIMDGVITASDAPPAPVISGGVIEASAGTEPDEVPGTALASGAPTITGGGVGQAHLIGGAILSSGVAVVAGGAFSGGGVLPAVTAYFRADALWREDFTATAVWRQ